MPWVIDGQSDSAYHIVSPNSVDLFERVITSDHEVLSKGERAQFAPNFEPDPENLIPFRRAEYEFGRCYYRLRKPRKTLPARAIDTWYCDRFKRTLEELEPGKHRFVQIDIRLPDGETPWPEPYWYWRCENFVDAVVPDIGDGSAERSTDYYWSPTRACLVSQRGSPKCTRPNGRNPLVVNRAAIAGLHAWRDNGFQFKFSIPHLFLSDDFHDRLTQAKAIIGLNVKQIGVSDLPATRQPVLAVTVTGAKTP